MNKSLNWTPNYVVTSQISFFGYFPSRLTFTGHGSFVAVPLCQSQPFAFLYDLTRDERGQGPNYHHHDCPAVLSKPLSIA